MTTDYMNNFDSYSFLQAFFTTLTPYHETVLKWLHEIFSLGDISGRTLLDVGTGPTVYSAISAAPYFTDIYFSDLVKGNREVLAKWWNGTLDHDFSPMFDAVSLLENYRRMTREMEEEIRQKLRAVLYCDVRQDHPLAPSVLKPVDAVVTAFCLESAATDIDDYRRIVRRVVSLVKLGGWVVAMQFYEETYYCFGGTVFKIAYLLLDDMRRAWEESGIDVKIWKIKLLELPKDICDPEGIFVLAGNRKF